MDRLLLLPTLLALATTGWAATLPAAQAACTFSLGGDCYGFCEIQIYGYCDASSACGVNVEGTCWHGGTCEVNVDGACDGACTVSIQTHPYDHECDASCLVHYNRDCTYPERP
jgi:hypothetical protein